MYWAGCGGWTAGVFLLILTYDGSISWESVWPIGIWMSVCTACLVFGRKR